jgi:hypothetical protein
MTRTLKYNAVKTLQLACWNALFRPTPTTQRKSIICIWYLAGADSVFSNGTQCNKTVASLCLSWKQEMNSLYFCNRIFSILSWKSVTMITVAGSEISASTWMQLFCKTLHPWSYLLLTSWCSGHCIKQCQCINVEVIDWVIKTKLRKRYLNVHLQK